MDERANILVVDDLPEKLLVYRTILDELGQNIVVARAARRPCARCSATTSPSSCSTCNMPGMNGLETAALIRQRQAVGPHADHLPDRVRRRGARRRGVRPGRGGLHHHAGRPGDPPGQGPGVLRPVPDDAAGPAAGGGADRAGRGAEQARGGRGGQSPARVPDHGPARCSASRSTRRRSPRTSSACHCRCWPIEALLVGRWNPDGTAGPDSASARRAGSSGPAAESQRADATGGSRSWSGRSTRSSLAGPAPPENGLRSSQCRSAPAVKLLAVLGLSRRPSGRDFTPADVTVARMFASRAASALENARLYHEVQQADRQKNEFLSMLAHELRNPLAPIRNANEVLRQKADDTTRVRWAQGVIDRQLTHLVRLVDDLLDVSRLTQGKIRLEVEEIGTRRRPRAGRRGRSPADRPVSARTGGPCLPTRPFRLMGDRARLTQVVTNLLNNAAKYTDPGGRIHSRGRARRQHAR